jgi:EcsC protein family
LWAEKDLQDLQAAVEKLEHPGWAIRLINFLGAPIEALIRFLPRPLSLVIRWLTERALGRFLALAIDTLGNRPAAGPALGTHRGLVLASGALGGFWGLPGLLLELPASTVILLRAIAAVARHEGEDLETAEARWACLEVFSLGGTRSGDDAAETGYYALRASLAKVVAEAAEYLAGRGAVQEGAPLLIRLLTAVTSRFGVVVSEKALAEMIPVLGALGGALINLLFVSHFQAMAGGHFVIRRLERQYGEAAVKREYERLAGVLRP